MTDEVSAIRKEIIHKFCRTILWIDDEIDLDNGLVRTKERLVNPLFKTKFEEFTKSGLLCHMMGFPDARPSPDPYASQTEVDDALNSCVSLARQSDVVIIDWMLGGTDSSEFAVKIISKLVGEGKGFRFVVVLSKQEPKESAFTAMSFEAVSDVLWKNKAGQFLLSLRKDDFLSTDLFAEICCALQNAYPDYLHLTALEIAGRIKNLVPRWLSALPSNTDMGILTERGNLMCGRSTKETWRDDIQECIVTNLFEDLTTIVLTEPLSALCDSVLCPSNVASDCLSTILASTDSTVRGVVDPLRKCLSNTPSAKLTANQYKQLSKHRGLKCISNFVQEVESYTEFCEKKSTLDRGICPGNVYLNLFADSEDIAVCISAACDCVRSESLLLLRGELMQDTQIGEVDVPDYDQIESQNGGKTVLRFQGKSYIFRHKANFLVTKSRSEICNSVRSVGTFRHDILNRLVDRFMSHVQRVGVNQPALSRDIRKEKTTDEE